MSGFVYLHACKFVLLARSQTNKPCNEVNIYMCLAWQLHDLIKAVYNDVIFTRIYYMEQCPEKSHTFSNFSGQAKEK